MARGQVSRCHRSFLQASSLFADFYLLTTASITSSKRRPDSLSYVRSLGIRVWREESGGKDSCRRQSQSGVLASAPTHGACMAHPPTVSATAILATSHPHPTRSKSQSLGLCSLHLTSKFVAKTLRSKGTNACTSGILYFIFHISTIFISLHFNVSRLLHTHTHIT